MALGDGVWRLLHPSGVVGTGIGGGLVVGGRGGGGGEQGGPACLARLLRSRAHVFYCMGTNVFFLFFIETKKIQVLNGALSNTLEHKSVPLSTYFFY